MGQAELDKDLADADVAAILTFLAALTGDLPADYIKMPTLPSSTGSTPMADPS